MLKAKIHRATVTQAELDYEMCIRDRSGVDAKFVIQDGLVTVNGEVETQRGKKLHGGELVSYNGETVKIVR